MILNYQGKKSEKEIAESIKECNLKSVSRNSKSKSKLIKRENLVVTFRNDNKFYKKQKVKIKISSVVTLEFDFTSEKKSDENPGKKFANSMQEDLWK